MPSPAVGGRPLSYVYFGGGTPSFLSVKQLERLVDRLHRSFGWDDAEEVTFECEPGTLSEAKVQALKRLGMTRISLGVENFSDAILEANGRAHLSAEIDRAWGWIKAAGFPNTNVDLIAGMVGETDESWRTTVDRTLAMEPDSVTIYQMELPPNTVFVHDAKASGTATAVADWPTKRRWVGEAFDAFLARGYCVSSGYTVVRDPATVHFRYRDMLWEGSDLVALGVASFGHLSGVHYQNEPNWEPYLTAVESGRLPIARGLVPTRRDLLLREVVLGLKRGALDTRRLAAKYGIDPLTEWAKQWDSLAAEGVLVMGSGSITHNLGEAMAQLRRGDRSTHPWASRFDRDVAAALEDHDHRALLRFLDTDDGHKNHPTPEHWLPLLYAVGAAGDDQVSWPTTGFDDGSLSMRSVRFG
jgi:oxygen-independent coproporphyrinogen-3 oxidase